MILDNFSSCCYPISDIAIQQNMGLAIVLLDYFTTKRFFLSVLSIDLAYKKLSEFNLKAFYEIEPSFGKNGTEQFPIFKSF